MSINRTSRRVHGLAAAMVVLLAVTIAACSSSGNAAESTGSSSSSATGGSSNSSASSDLTEAQFQQIASNYVNPPSTTGPKPVKSKNIWWMGAGNAIPAAKQMSDAAAAAAKQLGWTFHVADGKVNVDGGYATAIRTALAAHPDALVIQGQDCAQVEQPLEEAKAEGVPVLGVQSIDCSDEKAGAPSLIPIKYLYSHNAPTLEDYYNAWGITAAKYFIAATNGKARVIANLGIGGFYTYINEGFLNTIRTCAGCKILDTVMWHDADTIPNGPWINAFSAALAKNPTVNAVYIPLDSLLTSSGGLQAVKDSGLKPIVAGGNGNDPAVVQAVRDGQLTAITAAQDFSWLGYSAMDELNRYFNHQPSVPEGIGPTLADINHNLPSPGKGFSSSIPWESDYQKLWAAS